MHGVGKEITISIMAARRKVSSIFVILFFLSLIIFFFSQRDWLKGVTGIIEGITLPIKQSSFRFFHSYYIGDKNSELARLKDENRNLKLQVMKLGALEKDNRALRDQFFIGNPSPKNLLPVFIVGMPGFLPGVSVLDKIIIDKGSEDKVKVGSSIVFKDNLVGRVVKTSSHLSVVYLLNNKEISFMAKTVKTSALGVVKGTGGSLVLGNVLLSDTLQRGDMVVAKGDMQADGRGYPPDLVVGKIVSVNKKASSLFQSAEIESLLDVSKLEMVFVVIDNS